MFVFPLLALLHLHSLASKPFWHFIWILMDVLSDPLPWVCGRVERCRRGGRLGVVGGQTHGLRALPTTARCRLPRLVLQKASSIV